MGEKFDKLSIVEKFAVSKHADQNMAEQRDSIPLAILLEEGKKQVYLDELKESIASDPKLVEEVTEAMKGQLDRKFAIPPNSAGQVVAR